MSDHGPYSDWFSTHQKTEVPTDRGLSVGTPKIRRLLQTVLNDGQQ